MLMVTRRAEGSFLVTHDDEVLHAEAPEVHDLVDTVGAGDAFAAVLLPRNPPGVGLPGDAPARQRLRRRGVPLRRGDRHGPLGLREPPAALVGRPRLRLGCGRDTGPADSISSPSRVHGLVRGTDIELGRDADTGGQVSYVVDQARALAEHPRVDRVDVVTRLVEDRTRGRSLRASPGGAPVRRRTHRTAPLRPPALSAQGVPLALPRRAPRPARPLRARQGRLPDIIHSHYADAGYVGAQLGKLLGRAVRLHRALPGPPETGAPAVRWPRRGRHRGALSLPRRYRGGGTGAGDRRPGRRLHAAGGGRAIPAIRPLRARPGGRSSPRASTWSVSPRRPASGRSRHHADVRPLPAPTPTADDPGLRPPRRPEELRRAHRRVRAHARPPGRSRTSSWSRGTGTTSREMAPPTARPHRHPGAHRPLRSVRYRCVPEGPRPGTSPTCTGWRRAPGALREPGAHRALRPDPHRGRRQRPPGGGHRRRWPASILEACGNGVLADPLDSEELGARDARRPTDRGRWARWAKSGVARVHERFSWKSHAEALRRAGGTASCSGTPSTPRSTPRRRASTDGSYPRDRRRRHAHRR